MRVNQRLLGFCLQHTPILNKFGNLVSVIVCCGKVVVTVCVVVDEGVYVAVNMGKCQRKVP